MEIEIVTVVGIVVEISVKVMIGCQPWMHGNGSTSKLIWMFHGKSGLTALPSNLLLVVEIFEKIP